MKPINSTPKHRLSSTASWSTQPAAPQSRQKPKKRQFVDNGDDADRASSQKQNAPPPKKVAQTKKQPEAENEHEPIHVIGNLPLGENIDDSCEFITLSSSTSDEICRTEAHLPGGVPDLVNRLTVAVEATESLVSNGWQTRQDIYARTTVLLLSWADDDLRVQIEIRQLKSLFSDAFGYQVCEWELPSGPGVYLKTINKVGEFAAEYGGERTLLIIYYGGHGYQDLARQNSGPIWISRRWRDGDMVKPIELESSGLFPILAEQDGDVLLIFDCCQAVPSLIRPKGKGVVSALNAMGFEAGFLGIAPEPGVHSFTHSLVDELAATANMFRISPNPQPISDIELHVRLVTRLRQSASSVKREADGSLKKKNKDNLVCFEQQNRRTPHYQFLSAGRNPRPIYLKPDLTQKTSLSSASTTQSPNSGIEPRVVGSTSATPQSGSLTRLTSAPMVLIRVMLSHDEFDVQEWASWVLKCPEAALRVKIEGQWGSFSTLQIIRLPLDLWDLMPKHPAISFIGFVRTENQVGGTNEAVATRVTELQSPKQTECLPASDGKGERVVIKPASMTIKTNPPYTEDEKRFMYCELIKSTSVATALLETLIDQHNILGDWVTDVCSKYILNNLNIPLEETDKV